MVTVRPLPGLAVVHLVRSRQRAHSGGEKFYVSAKIDGFSLTGWAGDGPVAHVDLEIGLVKSLPLRGTHGLQMTSPPSASTSATTGLVM